MKNFRLRVLSLLRQKKYRAYFFDTTGIYLIVISVFFIISEKYHIPFLPKIGKRTEADKVFPYLFLLFGLGLLMLRYLEGDKDTKTRSNSNRKPLDTLYNESYFNFIDEDYKYRKSYRDMYRTINEIKNNVTGKEKLESNFTFTTKEREEIVESMKSNFITLNEDIFKKLSEETTSNLIRVKNVDRDVLKKTFASIRQRLLNEISNLSRRSNINLVIGSMVTAIGLGILLMITFREEHSFIDNVNLLAHYLPRLSLVLFVEFFAYFFLRMYRSNINDLKYYQNELTNIEMKLVSIETAIYFGKDVDISMAITEISKTERNFILRNNETTVEIEKSRMEKSNNNAIIKILTDLIPKK